jgi:plastocyanin
MMIWFAVLAFITPPPPRSHLVEIRGMTFHPAVLTIAPGDTVVWINRDIVPHTATAAVGGGAEPKWDTGQLRQGQDGRYVAHRRGEAPYVCTLHPTMQGKLIIQ